MPKDKWHFPRTELAQQIIGMFNMSLSNALIFFAPRRMGKTEFLYKDIFPYAQKQRWNVFYFSFLDASQHPHAAFTEALLNFAHDFGAIKNKASFLSKISRITGRVSGLEGSLEFRETERAQHTIREIISALSKKEKTLLLLDEVQVLAKDESNESFIASLRTALDINKDHIKVIFTGSSQAGLRRMFSQATAPFFHFGQNLPFPEFDQSFTDHLASTFEAITQRSIDKLKLWAAFIDLEKVPQLMRALIERLVLDPSQTIIQAKNALLTEVVSGRAYEEQWEKLSKLEQLILHEIASKQSKLFSESVRHRLSKKLGINTLEVPAVQSAIRTLQKKNIIGRLPDRAGYFIDDPNFKRWIADK